MFTVVYYKELEWSMYDMSITFHVKSKAERGEGDLRKFELNFLNKRMSFCHSLMLDLEMDRLSTVEE